MDCRVKRQIVDIILAEAIRQERGESEPTNNPLMEIVANAAARVNEIQGYPQGALHVLATFYQNHAAMRCLKAVAGEEEHCGTCNR
jgi:hypothetical protein